MASEAAKLEARDRLGLLAVFRSEFKAVKDSLMKQAGYEKADVIRPKSFAEGLALLAGKMGNAGAAKKIMDAEQDREHRARTEAILRKLGRLN